jgi:cytidyltransferase-like protein
MLNSYRIAEKTASVNHMASRKRAPAKRKKKVVVAVSGGFDPIHIGHVRMFEEARALGDELVVIINNDNWLREKKGYVFMPEQERKEVIEGMRAVDRVVITSHAPSDPDVSVCRALYEVRPDIFANGGDRKLDNIPEVAVCREIGCDMVFNVGKGGKVQSSSWLVAKQKERRDNPAMKEKIKKS